MRNRLFREHQAKACQEIEELTRICCEETDRARQARIDELFLHQERNSATVSQLLAHIQDFQNKVNSLSDAREFHDLDTASSPGASHIPSQPSFRVPEKCEAAILDCRVIHGILSGTSGKVFESLPARGGPSSSIFENSKNLAPLSGRGRK